MEQRDSMAVEWKGECGVSPRSPLWEKEYCGVQGLAFLLCPQSVFVLYALLGRARRWINRHCCVLSCYVTASCASQLQNITFSIYFCETTYFQLETSPCVMRCLPIPPMILKHIYFQFRRLQLRPFPLQVECTSQLHH